MSQWDEPGRFYSDREMVAIREAAFNESRKYSENLAKQLDRTKATLLIAEAFIPKHQRQVYEALCRAAFE